MSHSTEILKYMENGGRITALDALAKFGCMNLKGRIWDIKTKLHINADRVWVKLPNGKLIMEYYIKK